MPSGDLRLELISANGLQQANNLRFIGLKQDPYCFIKIDDQKKRSKTHDDGGSNPTWNETFSFSSVSHMSVMKVQLLDENTWTTDNYIGECVIPLDNVVTSGHQQVNAPVFIRRRRKGSNKVEVQGNLTCRLEWTPTVNPGPRGLPPVGGYWILDTDMRGSFKERYSLPDHRKPLGKGSYGETHRVIHRQTGKEFACKIINKASIRANRMETDMQLEIKILNHLYKGHANIINVEEVVEDEKRIYVIMELCTGGELYDHIVERADNYSEADAAAIICTVLDVVHYCHTAGVVHRDLKPENFLFTKKGAGACLKAIDFGLGQFIRDDEQLYDVVGSPYYIAPEVLRAKPGVQGYSKEVDIWSCGVILYILLCGQPPFVGDEGGHEQDIHRCILTQKLDLESPPWNQISRQAKTVVAAMLHRDPRKRAKVEDLLRDQWITGGAPKTTIRNLVVDRMRAFAQGNKLRRQAIFMIARELPQSEVEGLRKLFMEMDEDGNGVITIDEMRRALRKMGSMLPTTELEEIMKLADANGDNTIDWQEFIAAIMNHSKVLRRDRIQRVFEQLDADASGFLDRNELAAAFRELNISDLDDAMRQADQDNDGTISFDEFFEFMTREM